MEALLREEIANLRAENTVISADNAQLVTSLKNNQSLLNDQMAGVDRLKDENQLLKLSRGSTPPSRLPSAPLPPPTPVPSTDSTKRRATKPTIPTPVSPPVASSSTSTSPQYEPLSTSPIIDLTAAETAEHQDETGYEKDSLVGMDAIWAFMNNGGDEGNAKAKTKDIVREFYGFKPRTEAEVELAKKKSMSAIYSLYPWTRYCEEHWIVEKVIISKLQNLDRPKRERRGGAEAKSKPKSNGKGKENAKDEEEDAGEEEEEEVEAEEEAEPEPFTKKQKLNNPEQPIELVVQQFEPPIIEPIIAPIIAPVIAPVMESIIEPVMESIIEPVMESIIQPVIEPVVAPIIEPVVASINEPVISPITAPIIAPVFAPAIEPVVASINEPVIERASAGEAEGEAVHGLVHNVESNAIEVEEDVTMDLEQAASPVIAPVASPQIESTSIEPLASIAAATLSRFDEAGTEDIEMAAEEGPSSEGVVPVAGDQEMADSFIQLEQDPLSTDTPLIPSFSLSRSLRQSSSVATIDYTEIEESRRMVLIGLKADVDAKTITKWEAILQFTRAEVENLSFDLDNYQQLQPLTIPEYVEYLKEECSARIEDDRMNIFRTLPDSGVEQDEADWEDDEDED